jgi:RNA 2',3'-cyclic 3'-phosphodiesterase
VRLFVAVACGPPVTDAAGSVIDTLRTRATRLAPRARLSWVRPDRLHFTLAFIGETSESALPGIVTALAPPLPVRVFALEIAGTGVFPDRGRPRVVWVGVGEGRDRLVAVAGAVRSQLTGVGVELEARPFSPHMTLARVKDAAGLQPDALLHGLADVVLGRMMVDAITLFQSRLSPSGSSYHPIATSPLSREEG